VYAPLRNNDDFSGLQIGISVRWQFIGSTRKSLSVRMCRINIVARIIATPDSNSAAADQDVADAGDRFESAKMPTYRNLWQHSCTRGTGFTLV